MRTRQSLEYEDAIYFCTQCGSEAKIREMTKKQFREWLWCGQCTSCQEEKDGKETDLQ